MAERDPMPKKAPATRAVAAPLPQAPATGAVAAPLPKASATRAVAAPFPKAPAIRAVDAPLPQAPATRAVAAPLPHASANGAVDASFCALAPAGVAASISAGVSASAAAGIRAGVPVADTPVDQAVAGDAPDRSAPSLDPAFVHELNELLVTTLNSVERYEERAMRANGIFGLSVSEAHTVETIGTLCRAEANGVTVTAIADAMLVRVPTATVAVNRLLQKGLVTKGRDAADGRRVVVRLTRDGRKAYKLHALFHSRMAHTMAAGTTPAEQAALLDGMRKLRAFFDEELPAAYDAQNTRKED